MSQHFYFLYFCNMLILVVTWWCICFCSVSYWWKSISPGGDITDEVCVCDNDDSKGDPSKEVVEYGMGLNWEWLDFNSLINIINFIFNFLIWSSVIVLNSGNKLSKKYCIALFFVVSSSYCFLFLFFKYSIHFFPISDIHLHWRFAVGKSDVGVFGAVSV